MYKKNRKRLVGLLLGLGLALGGCGNAAEKDQTINAFGDKVKTANEFTADIKVKSTVEDKDGSVLEHQKYNRHMVANVDFKEQELLLHIKEGSSKENQESRDVYIRDRMSYMSHLGDWMMYPITAEADYFAEFLDVKSLSSIYSEVQMVSKDIEYSKTKGRISLKASKLTNVKFDDKALDAVFGPLSGLDKAKVKQYSIEIVLNPKTYLPTSIKRNVSITIEDITYHTDTYTEYKDWKKVDVSLPEEAFNARIAE